MRQKIQEELKQEVIKKIYQEFTDYRSNLRNESSSNLIAEAYKIETFSSLYEVLMEKSTQLSDVALLNLLNMGTGILEGLYEKWLGVKDLHMTNQKIMWNMNLTNWKAMDFLKQYKNLTIKELGAD